MSATVDLGYCEITVLEPGILNILFRKDTDLDEPVAVEMLTGILKLTGGEPHGLIYDFNKKNIVIREIARKLSGVRDARTSKMICRAFVVHSLQNKLESKHYIQSGKPSAETKYFNKKDEALAWVRSCLKEFEKKGKTGSGPAE